MITKTSDGKVYVLLHRDGSLAELGDTLYFEGNRLADRQLVGATEKAITIEYPRGLHSDVGAVQVKFSGGIVTASDYGLEWREL